jgi:hypothetical protein
VSEKSNFTVTVDIAGIQKCGDLLDNLFHVIPSCSPKRGSSTTTHAQVWINCHSAIGADKRPCISWFLLFENGGSPRQARRIAANIAKLPELVRE